MKGRNISDEKGRMMGTGETDAGEEREGRRGVKGGGEGREEERLREEGK